MWTNSTALSASDPVVLEAAILERRSDLDDEAQAACASLGTRVEEKFLSGSAFDELVTAATKAKAATDRPRSGRARSRPTIILGA